MHSYGKVYNLGHAAIKELLLDNVIVEEKIDGSQFNFLKTNNGLEIHSHRQKLIPEAAHMFQEGVDYLLEIQDKLHPGWVYRGEYLKKPKQNSINYDRIPNNHVMIFDIDRADQDYLPYDEKVEEAKRLGFEAVPKLLEGKLSFEDFEALLERTSVLGGAKIEGVVIKNYSRFGKDGKALMGKYVSEKFRELSRHTERIRNPGAGDIKLKLGERYRTEARWEKALIHLREDGKITGELKDIGLLVKEVPRDILEECEEEIKQTLFDWAWRDLQRKVIAGIPEWYKNKLTKEQFEKGD